jgi:hypothetical protein
LGIKKKRDKMCRDLGNKKQSRRKKETKKNHTCFICLNNKCENKTEQKSKKETKDKHKSTFTHKTTDIGHPSFS